MRDRFGSYPPPARIRGVGFVVAMLAWLAPAAASALDTREFTLDNGLKGIVARESKAPVVIVQVWYRVGSADEKPGKTGLSHMLEHMMFQGTETVPPEQFSRIIAREGGEDNASTTTDYTMYYVKLASDRLELALRLEADRMRGLKLAEEEFKSENLVVREERRMRTDADPNQRMLERYRALVFGDHPYGRPVIGAMNEIEALTLTDLASWYQTYYAPNNATLVVVGDVDLEATEKLVRNYFSPLPAQPEIPRPRLPDPPRRETPARLEVIDKAAKLPIWMAGYTVPSLAMTPDSNDAMALDILAAVLGGGNTSRLHNRLIREQALAVSASCSYSGHALSWEQFSLSAMPKAGTDLKAIEAAMFTEVERLQKEPVPARELEKAQNGLIAERVYTMDSIDHIAWVIGRMSLNGVNWRVMFDDYPARVRAVTSADLQRVATRYLQPERLTVGILKP
ncbi:MAG: insulinase family protein [Magnetococcales bacterium]|nr:insulinase family protein [Magnetococcales bacterium]